MRMSLTSTTHKVTLQSEIIENISGTIRDHTGAVGVGAHVQLTRDDQFWL